MKIRKMTISDFKGIKEKEIEFSDKTIISGMNGSGKSTIISAFYWVLFDKDVNLTSNPPVIPLGVADCIPRVDLELELADGKVITITKMQKTKVTKQDGMPDKISTSNTYEWNCVPLTERDFKAKLTECGLPDADLFMCCTHPDVFVSKKQSDMRAILFELTTSKSDLDIANGMQDAPELAELLKNYTFDEISAMNKASKKKASELSASIPNQIIGLESAKVSYDVAELELQKSAMTEQLDALLVKLNDITNEEKRTSEISVELLDLEFEINSLIVDARKSSNAEHDALGDELVSIHNKIVNINRELGVNGEEIERQAKNIEINNRLSESYKNKLDELEHKVMSENDLVCTLCGQPLPEDKVEESKKNFESYKTENINLVKEKIMDVELDNECIKQRIELAENKVSELRAELEKVKAEYSEKKNLYDNYVEVDIDYESNPSIKKLVEKREKLTIEQKECEGIDANAKNELLIQINDVKAEISEIEQKIGEFNSNVRIDERIEELQEQLIKNAQAESDADKILWQLDLLSKEKNNLLVEEINSHFSLVKWKLFEFQKNGNYKEVCSALIGDKELGKSMNTALELTAKFDIVNGLQDAFGIDVPILADNTECMDDFTTKNITSNRQLILFRVSNEDLKITND